MNSSEQNGPPTHDAEPVSQRTEQALSSAERERLESDPDAVLAEAFSQYHEPFRNLVTFRMDRRLLSRVDPDDVLQEAFLAAKSRLDHFIDAEQYSLFVWLRMIVVQSLYDVHRRHLSAEKRSASREINLAGASVRYPQTTSISIASQLAAVQTTPSGVAVRGEALDVLEQAISTLSEQDQEVIAMRHFENLNNKQVAEVLGLSSTAASNRYVRALERLRDVLERVGVGLPK